MVPRQKQARIRLFAHSKTEIDLYSTALSKLNNIEYISLDAQSKDQSKRRLVDEVFYTFYCAKHSLALYGYYHSLIERTSRSVIRSTINRLLLKFRKSKPLLFERVYDALESFVLFGFFCFFRTKKSISHRGSSNCIDIYAISLTSSRELDCLRSSLNFGNRILVITRNWDNPCSKSLLSTKYVDYVTSWSRQMDEHIDQLSPGIPKFRYTSPRFDYLKKLKKADPTSHDNRSFVVYYVGSQKRTNVEIDNLTYLARASLESDDLRHVVYIYRPHPWNPLPNRSIINRLLECPNVKLDDGINQLFLASSATDAFHLPIAALGNTLPDSLQEHLKTCDLLMSPAGTLCLEAGLAGKPVAVDLTNYSQVTLKLHCYLDHFASYSTESWVRLAFRPYQLVDCVRHFITHSINPRQIRSGSAIYADLFGEQSLDSICAQILDKL